MQVMFRGVSSFFKIRVPMVDWDMSEYLQNIYKICSLKKKEREFVKQLIIQLNYHKRYLIISANFTQSVLNHINL